MHHQQSSLSTVFLDLHPKMKESLDRKKIYTYSDIMDPKNERIIKQLNIPIQDIKNKYNESLVKFQSIWYSSFISNIKSLPKLQNYAKITQCVIAGKEGQITQISGQKSSGKTCLMLEIASQYLKRNPSKNISIINGSSGITKIRLDKLPFERISYIDVYTLPMLASIFEKPAQDDIGMVIIDGFLKMVKSIEKPRQQLKSLMAKFKKYSDKVKFVIQNYSSVDRILTQDNRPIYNNAAEYFWIISNLCENRISCHKLPNKQYKLFLNKSKYPCSQIYQKFEINDYGYKEIN